MNIIEKAQALIAKVTGAMEVPKKRPHHARSISGEQAYKAKALRRMQKQSRRRNRAA